MTNLCGDVGRRSQTISTVDLHFGVLELISTCFNTGTTDDKIKCKIKEFYNVMNGSFYLYILLKIVQVSKYTSLQIYTRYKCIKFR